MVGAFNALSAVGGGIGLLTPGSMGLPVSVLSGSPFTSFLWPALVLLVVVGGTQLAAVATAVRHTKVWPSWFAFAGFGMLIFVFTEVAIMQAVVPLHVIYFGTGLLQLILVVAVLDVVPSTVTGRRVSPGPD